MTSSTQSAMLQFCSFIGRLKHLKRTGWVKKGVPEPESVASHMYRMAILAFLFDESSVDRNKYFIITYLMLCLLVYLLENLHTIYLTFLVHQVSNEEKFQREKAAMEKLAALIPKNVGDEFISLWEEYGAGKTAEARAVKDLDKYDMIVQAYEYELQTEKPNSLQEFFDSTSDWFKTDAVKQWVADLQKVRATDLEFQDKD